MKLNNLTIVFTIIFLCFLSMWKWKNETDYVLSEKINKFEKACSSGICAAAAALAEEYEYEDEAFKTYFSERIVLDFYEATTAALALDNTKSIAMGLKRMVPIICIVREYEYELIYPSITEEKNYEYISGGRISYGINQKSNEKLCVTKEHSECIPIIEAALEKAIYETLRLYGCTDRIKVELPKDDSNNYLRKISNPAVLAISITESGEQYKRTISLYGAELTPAEQYYLLEGMTGKELHSEKCEKINRFEIPEENRFDLYKEGVQAGGLPQECCDPIGAYMYKFIVGNYY